MATITKKQYEAAIAIINAFNAGKEKPMKKSAPVKDIVSVLTEEGLKLSRVSATTAGKTGYGVEFEVEGMTKRDDLSTPAYKGIRAIYNYMKADFKKDKAGNLVRTKDGEPIRTRNCFFYLGFPTKKDRDAEVKRLNKFLVPSVDVDPAPAPKKASAKKSTPKKADTPAVAPSAKDILLTAIAGMSEAEKKALIAALIA